MPTSTATALEPGISHVSDILAWAATGDTKWLQPEVRIQEGTVSSRLQRGNLPESVGNQKNKISRNEARML